MKELNRRAFLTLTGAAVAMMALAGCSGEPSVPPAPPAAPTTGEEVKVLEALNLYRKKAGVDVPLTMDDGLKPAAELVVTIIKGKMAFDDKAAEALGKALEKYNGFYPPIGILMDNDDTKLMLPLCVYSEDAEKMAQKLPLQLDENVQKNLKSPAVKLVSIQIFEYDRMKYWIAVIADSKK